MKSIAPGILSFSTLHLRSDKCFTSTLRTNTPSTLPYVHVDDCVERLHRCLRLLATCGEEAVLARELVLRQIYRVAVEERTVLEVEGVAVEL